METVLVVLWFYYSISWTWLGFEMTPGWASVAVLDAESCKAVVERVAPIVAECHLPGVFKEPISQFWHLIESEIP